MPDRTASDRKAALRAVEDRFGEFKDVLCELVRVPGVSAAGFPPEDAERVFERVRRHFSEAEYHRLFLKDG